MSQSIERLFVYGSLAPGQPNHDVVESIEGCWEKAILRGTLYDAGWGADLGCPGIVPSPDGDEVEGYVLSSSSLAQYWEHLDAFEGSEYLRVEVTVRVTGEGEVTAYVYALNLEGSTSGRR